LIAKDDGISEFNLDLAIGAINEVVDIADLGKIEVASAQKLAIESATISLFSVTESPVKANKGFRAISVLPMLSEGRPVAVVTLLGPDGFRVVAGNITFNPTHLMGTTTAPPTLPPRRPARSEIGAAEVLKAREQPRELDRRERIHRNFPD
jgi:hypothetical protein